MRTAEKQVETLQAIPGIHEAMTEALDEAALIDTIQADSADPSTPFALWRCRAEGGLMDDAVAFNRADNRAERKDAADRAEAARARRKALRAEIADVQKQQHLNGGDTLDAAERDLKAFDAALAAAKEERAKFAARTEALGRHAATREQFEVLRHDREAFLSDFPSRQAELRDQRDQTIKDAQPLLTEQAELRRETASLAGRRGLVPHDLHAARLAVAEAMGLTADDLPFAAELIDMQPQFEPWRTAAELALGGFAVTMLVDQQRLPRLRRSINSLEMRRRLRFEGVPSNQPVRQHPDASILPGRGSCTGETSTQPASPSSTTCASLASRRPPSLWTTPPTRAYEQYGAWTDDKGKPVPCSPRRQLPALTPGERHLYQFLTQFLTDPAWTRVRRVEQERIPLQVAAARLDALITR